MMVSLRMTEAMGDSNDEEIIDGIGLEMHWVQVL